MPRTNEHGQPIGDPVDWSPPRALGPIVLDGRTCTVTPLGVEHHRALFAALCERSGPEVWTYIGGGPFGSLPEFTDYVEALLQQPAMVPMAIEVPGAEGASSAAGMACFMRIDVPNGSAEVGNIVLGAELQGTTAATEALYLMARHAFAHGYRRWEWKCDALNEPSRRAAIRLGFRYEGRFRQAVVYKARNRDTDWFSITDGEWPACQESIERWLAPANFDSSGRQSHPLATPRREERLATMRDAHPES